MPDPSRRLEDPDSALRSLLAGADAGPGTSPFERLVRGLAEALDVHGAWVTEYLPERRRLRALAFWAGDRFVPDYEYDVAGTSCEPVLERACLVNFPERVADLFPLDADLRAQHAESYMGVPLRDDEGRILGHLAVIDTRPLPEEPRLLAVFRLFAERAAAELRAALAERAWREAADEAAWRREEMQSGAALVGRSAALAEVRRQVALVAPGDTTVLVLGETGTGKELVASAIHEQSARSARAFVRVNCAAIPATLIESEFFGHEKGAFTGATARREGRFALADRGTLFLDEVGELPLELQPKLLRALQEGEFEPVGATRARKVDVRVIAATNRDLQAEVRAGRFREDLFYRLSVFPLRLPPLRERRDDIAPLAERFVSRIARRLGKPFRPPGLEALARLREYDWPGNVRELQNVIERALVTSVDGRLDLDRALPAAAPTAPPGGPAAGLRVLTDAELRALERDNLERALAQCGGRVAGAGGAAELLGVKPSTLRSRMKGLGLGGREIS